MAVAADASVLQPDKFGPDTRLIEKFRQTMTKDCMKRGLRHHDHHWNVLEIGELARWRFLHPAHELIRTVCSGLALKSQLASIVDRWGISDRNIDRAP